MPYIHRYDDNYYKPSKNLQILFQSQVVQPFEDPEPLTQAWIDHVRNRDFRYHRETILKQGRTNFDEPSEGLTSKEKVLIYYSTESHKLPNVLEISTRSPNPFGKSLNPFNLQITLKSGRKIKVECAYQGSKVLEDGAQFPELYWGSPRDAALDRRIKGKRPASFKLFNKEYPTKPKHAFFDWLYIIGLCQRKDDVFLKLSQFDGFSDIYYSQRIDPNSQGRAAAKYVALIENGLIEEETPSREILEILLGNKP